MVPAMVPKHFFFVWCSVSLLKKIQTLTAINIYGVGHKIVIYA